MAASDNMSPRQFDRGQRLQHYKNAPTFAQMGHTDNPFAAHKPLPMQGLTWDHTAPQELPVEHVPVDRLESMQPMVQRPRVNNMMRRTKTAAPPIEVSHDSQSGRYMIEEGNHRAVVALKRGDVTIPAVVVRKRV